MNRFYALVALVGIGCTSGRPEAPVVEPDVTQPVIEESDAAYRPPTLVPAATITAADLPKPTSRPAPALEEFAGAARCESCHAEVYAQWSGSTHGQAGGPPTPKTVIPSFAGEPLKFKDATVRPVLERGKYAFVVEERGRPKVRYTVDAVVGAGRIHGGGTQAYFTLLKDGRYAMLPFDYSVSSETWFCQNSRRSEWTAIDEGVRLRDCEYPPARVLGVDKGANCQGCHGSQIGLSFNEARGRYETKWTSLNINCESCHGPGRAHAEAATKGAEEVEMEALALSSKERSVAICARCHEDKSAVSPGYLAGGEGENFYSTAHLRKPSGRRFNLDGEAVKFSYQEGHHWSACYRDGSMTCVDCHDPHTGGYRDIFGGALPGRFDDGQCTGCHPSKGEGSRHGGHQAKKLPCTSCHMTMKQHPGVGEHIPYKRSDHSISSPRAPSNTRGRASGRMVCEDCHKDEGPQWALAAWRDLFGVGRPPLAALEILRRVERSLVEPPSVPGMPRMPSTKPVSPEAVFEAVRAMESTHRPAIVRALSALVLVLPKVQIPEVPADIALRLGVWAKSLDLQVRAASIATCLFLTPYEPKLSHIAKRGLVATTAEDQEALRRHIVFNLLAILYSVEGGNTGAVTLARRAIEEYGVVLADDENPIASALAASYASAGEQRTAMKWALRSLNGQSFKGVTYPLDSTGTRADTLSRAAHLLGKGGSNRGAIDRYREALKVNPRHAAAQEALCVELIKGGRKGEAIECIDRYLIIKPDFVQGHFIKAKLYEETGKVRAAIKSVVRGLKIDPDNQAARSNLRRLQGRQ